MFGAMIGTWYKGHKGWLQEREWSDALNKKGGKAKGINAEVMRPLWKLMHTAAKKSTPPGLTPFLLLDRAPAHTRGLRVRSSSSDSKNSISQLVNGFLYPSICKSK